MSCTSLTRKAWLRGALYCVLLSAAMLLASRYTFGPVFVPTDSMAPTVQGGTYVFVNRLAYGTGSSWYKRDVLRWSQPERGDIIVFKAPATPRARPGTYFLKRVVALAGDTVQVSGHRLTVNGKPLDYERLKGPDLWSESGGGAPHPVRLRGKALADVETVTVPAGCLWVMGDNRGASLDSRSWGCVPTGTVEGKVLPWLSVTPR